jgi:hypothetical protein
MALAALPAAPGRAEGIWTEAALPPSATLNSVAYSGRSVAWAVGQLGGIFRYGRLSWEVFPSGTGNDLYSVAAVGNGEAWAVGAGGVIIHYNGNSWDVDVQGSSLTLLDLRAVTFLNPANGWAAGGGSATPAGIILHYDGAAWAKVLSPTRTVYGVAEVSSDYIWFCGANGMLVQFDGTHFTEYTVGTGDWRSISFPYRRLGWAVGTGGRIARFSPGTYPAPGWGPVASPTGLDLAGVCVLPDPEWGYAVGAQGIRLALGGDGAWRTEVTGGGDLRGVDLPNHMEGAAVGGTSAVRIVMVRERTTEKNLAEVRAFPNPFDPGKGGVLTFDRLPPGVTDLDIMTIRGEVVSDLKHGITYDPVTGIATWNGRMRWGGVPATGPYMYRISAPGSKTAQGRILVVKR